MLVLSSLFLLPPLFYPRVFVFFHVWKPKLLDYGKVTLPSHFSSHTCTVLCRNIQFGVSNTLSSFSLKHTHTLLETRGGCMGSAWPRTDWGKIRFKRCAHFFKSRWRQFHSLWLSFLFRNGEMNLCRTVRPTRLITMRKQFPISLANWCDS